MKITFLGATRTVTGSCYLVENDTVKFLVDCGLFQGEDVYERNYEKFDFDPKGIDFVVLTHAHMDHSGLLPKLVKEGFKGKIYTTIPTTQLSEILLLDAAKIQEGNQRRGKGAESGKMLYSTPDSLKTISLLSSQTFDDVVQPADGVKFKFISAGHILGAACVLLEIEDKKIVFSGDLGRIDEAIIPSFKQTSKEFNADYVVMESLYGGVTHQTRLDAENELIEIINHTIQRGGNVVIPSFAVHKTQELLVILKKAFENNEIDRGIQVVLDSPLASKATKIYAQNSLYFDDVKYKNTESNFFGFPNLKITTSHKESLKLSGKQKTIYIAGSGMVEGGRVIRHLIHHLGDQKHSVIFVGYQAEGTKGREILEGAGEVKLDKKHIRVQASIERIEGFSSHADHNDLLIWLENFKTERLKKVFLTHADIERSYALEDDLKKLDYSPYIPNWKEAVKL